MAICSMIMCNDKGRLPGELLGDEVDAEQDQRDAGDLLAPGSRWDLANTPLSDRKHFLTNRIIMPLWLTGRLMCTVHVVHRREGRGRSGRPAAGARPGAVGGSRARERGAGGALEVGGGACAQAGGLLVEVAGRGQVLGG